MISGNNFGFHELPIKQTFAGYCLLQIIRDVLMISRDL